jgi:hypothetical protein
MSGPTKGMVAGKAITTGDLTREFEEGFERIFGKDRKPVRGRFVYDAEAGQMVEVGAEWTDTPRRAQTPTEELTYGGVRATDGTDISSKRKRREWMKQNNLADADDFKGTWEKAEKERAKYYQGTHDTREIRETVGRALYESRKARKR